MAVITHTIEPGYWVNLNASSPYGFAGLCVTEHAEGMISGTLSTKGREHEVVSIREDHPSIMSHTMPDFAAFDRLAAQFKAGEISRSEFVNAFETFV